MGKLLENGLEGYWKGVYDKGQGDMKVSLAQNMLRLGRFTMADIVDSTNLPLNQLLAIKSGMKL